MPPRNGRRTTESKGVSDARNYLKALADKKSKDANAGVAARRAKGIYASVKPEGTFTTRKLSGAPTSVWRPGKSTVGDIYVEDLRLSGPRQAIIAAVTAVDGRAPNLAAMTVYDSSILNLPATNPLRARFDQEVAALKSTSTRGKKEDPMAWLAVIDRVHGNLLPVGDARKQGAEPKKKATGKKKASARSSTQNLKARYDALVLANRSAAQGDKKALNVSDYEAKTGTGARTVSASGKAVALFAADSEGVLVSNNRKGIREAAKAIFGKDNYKPYVDAWDNADGNVKKFATKAARQKASK